MNIDLPIGLWIYILFLVGLGAMTLGFILSKVITICIEDIKKR